MGPGRAFSSAGTVPSGLGSCPDLESGKTQGWGRKRAPLPRSVSVQRKAAQTESRRTGQRWRPSPVRLRNWGWSRGPDPRLGPEPAGGEPLDAGRTGTGADRGGAGQEGAVQGCPFGPRTAGGTGGGARGRVGAPRCCRECLSLQVLAWLGLPVLVLPFLSFQSSFNLLPYRGPPPARGCGRAAAAALGAQASCPFDVAVVLGNPFLPTLDGGLAWPRSFGRGEEPVINDRPASIFSKPFQN